MYLFVIEVVIISWLWYDYVPVYICICIYAVVCDYTTVIQLSWINKNLIIKKNNNGEKKLVKNICNCDNTLNVFFVFFLHKVERIWRFGYFWFEIIGKVFSILYCLEAVFFKTSNSWLKWYISLQRCKVKTIKVYYLWFTKRTSARKNLSKLHILTIKFMATLKRNFLTIYFDKIQNTISLYLPTKFILLELVFYLFQ